MIQPIHTAVKGRARYKVNGLYHSEALKKYLELRLLQAEIIEQVCANTITGNVLVIFNPNFNHNAIASLIKEVILDYLKKDSKLLQFLTKQSNVVIPNGRHDFNKSNKHAIGSDISELHLQKKLNLASSQLIPIAAGISALFFGTAMLYRLGLDERILLGIQNLHSPLLHRMMIAVTFLGDPTVLLLLCLGLRSWLLQSNRRQEANILGIATIGAIGFNCTLKVLFARARPVLWDRIIHVGHHSFPSGHAMVSIVVYGYIGYILMKQFPQYEKQISTLTVALITAIGFSRLYLGVHWLTDVTAGYATGLIWLIFCILRLESQQQYSDSGFKSFTNPNQLNFLPIKLQHL